MILNKHAKYIWWSEKCEDNIPNTNLTVWLFVNILSMGESQLENRVGKKTADISLKKSRQ